MILAGQLATAALRQRFHTEAAAALGWIIRTSFRSTKSASTTGIIISA
jgi:hypothetical protein